MLEQRRLTRRRFSYYMRVMNDVTGELVGYWTDISSGGFRLETFKPISQDTVFRFRVVLSSEIANKTFMVFGARSRWCQQDPFDPNLYAVGFQISGLSPDDSTIFTRMFEKYGSENSVGSSAANYSWK
jgi:hypothetical protein